MVIEEGKSVWARNKFYHALENTESGRYLFYSCSAEHVSAIVWFLTSSTLAFSMPLDT